MLEIVRRIRSVESCVGRRIIPVQFVPEIYLPSPVPVAMDSQDARLGLVLEADFFFIGSSSSFKI